MKKHWKILAGVMLVATLATACNEGVKVPTGQAQEDKQQRQSTESLVNNQPLPHFNYSQARQNFIELETAMATGVQSTSFFFNQGAVDPIDTCPSIGVPIPNTASLSNPQQVVTDHNQYGGGNVAIGQMDPIGIYVPSSSTGTFVVCVDAQGKAYANYWEGFVKTVFAPAKWNEQTHKVELVGPPSFAFSTKK